MSKAEGKGMADKKNTDGLELAFAFAAGEFLDEELGELEYAYNCKEFIENGVYVKNPDSMHPHEWWARPEDIKKLNALIKSS